MNDNIRVTAHDIDHGIRDQDPQTEDTNADPDGAEERTIVRRSGTPAFITDEFQWIPRQGVIMTPETRILDTSWQLRALPATVDAVVEDAPSMLKARQDDILGDKSLQQDETNLYRDMLELFRTSTAMNNWSFYGIAFALLQQSAKEIASATRFAQRADDWLNRDPEAEGPVNMMESAYGQSTRGACLLNACIHAYNDVADEGASPLKVDARLFRTGAYTALGIEASKLAKTYDHPGKSEAKKSAGARAQSLDFQRLLGKAPMGEATPVAKSSD